MCAQRLREAKQGGAHHLTQVCRRPRWCAAAAAGRSRGIAGKGGGHACAALAVGSGTSATSETLAERRATDLNGLWVAPRRPKLGTLSVAGAAHAAIDERQRAICGDAFEMHSALATWPPLPRRERAHEAEPPLAAAVVEQHRVRGCDRWYWRRCAPGRRAQQLTDRFMLRPLRGLCRRRSTRRRAAPGFGLTVAGHSLRRAAPGCARVMNRHHVI